LGVVELIKEGERKGIWEFKKLPELEVKIDAVQEAPPEKLGLGDKK
jgi:hypothetical protein